MRIWFQLVIINCIMVLVSIGVRAREAGASHNACLHIELLYFDGVIILLTVFEMLWCSVF